MLTDRARSKMIALAGPRYNPERETIRVVGKRCVHVPISYGEILTCTCNSMANTKIMETILH